MSTHAEGVYSHAEGEDSSAYGYTAHAEGSGTVAEGEYSHAEGQSTFAGGNFSHAEGYIAFAGGEASHAEGNNTTAIGKYIHVQGKFNIEDGTLIDGIPVEELTLAHIVGNGESEDARSNAHTLDWEGNAWYAGDVYDHGSHCL